MLSKIIRKILENLSIFFSNNLDNLKFDDDSIYEIINKKIDIVEKNLGNLKETHITFNKSLYKIIRERKLKKFLRYAFIQKMFFVHNRLFIFKELNQLKKNKKWSYYKTLLLEDDVGDPVRYFLYPSSSGNKINHVYHLSCLEDTLNIELQKLTNIFEFGGGYGCMARIFSKINYKISYKIFDTYLVNCLQYYYLKQNGLEVGFENNRFDLINNFERINDKVDLKNSLFIANWSLSEVPLDLRDKFVSLIERYENIMISFQENFEDINNLKYFKNFQENLKHKYNIKIIVNKFYKGNILNPEKHYFLFGKKL